MGGPAKSIQSGARWISKVLSWLKIFGKPLVRISHTWKRERFGARFLATASLGILVVAAPIYASTVLQTSARKMLAQSELVFEGRVESVESRMNPGGTSIHTYVTFRILDVIKGAWPAETIELSFLGGTADGKTLVVAGMQIPELGEQGIYFVESPARNQVHPLYGWAQGHLRLNRSNGGALNVLTADGVPVIGIDDTQRGQSGGISRGVAVGLVVDPDAPKKAGISVKEFKEILRGWLDRSP
jgi:hypothetical protein